MMLVIGSKSVYLMTNNMLLNGFLLRQILIVALFTSKNFAANVLTVDEKPTPTRPTTKLQKLNRQSTYVFLFCLCADPVVGLGASLRFTERFTIP